MDSNWTIRLLNSGHYENNERIIPRDLQPSTTRFEDRLPPPDIVFNPHLEMVKKQ